ncbi:MAG: choice-of-anchor J domain-containing protein, partial [ANME-2 cluster archaeon]|nr:choice-of-anchor J domain-containing protein [ANME-2 cluster archaeon]
MKNGIIITLLIILSFSSAAGAMPAVTHSGNYTAVLTYGQTPYQVGYLSSGNNTGWLWWDSRDDRQRMEQQNIILVNILENGTAGPISGLSPPAFYRTTENANFGTYTYKADYDGTGNYDNNMDMWHILDNYSTYNLPYDDLDLTGYTEAELTFWTIYGIEENNDFGYVKISTDRGKTWTTLETYTGTDPSSWTYETISLTPYAGNKVMIAFNFISDEDTVSQGWYIDEIQVEKSSPSATSLSLSTILTLVKNFFMGILGISPQTILYDDAETAPPELSVEVTYPHYDYSPDSFSTRNRIVTLEEDYLNPGLYYGVFFYKNENDTYSGEYNINFTGTMPDSSVISSNTSFTTTLWGCQARGCHDAWSPQSDPSTRNPTRSIHPDQITSVMGGNCMTMCHSPYSSQFLTATPAHVHETLYGHEGGFIKGVSGWVTIYNTTDGSEPGSIVEIYRKSSVVRPPSQTSFNIPSHVTDTNCKDCHTTFIHDNTGGVNYNITDPYTLTGSNLSYTGVHNKLSCEYCHGDLAYPAFTGNQQVSDTIGDYIPEFVSFEALTKSYIINTDGTDHINISVSFNNSLEGMTLVLIGPMNDSANGLQDLNENDKWKGTYFVPAINGSISFNTEKMLAYPFGDVWAGSIPDTFPRAGIWIARIYSWSEEMANYTITSNYPIEKKPIIHIPWNCSECHNPSGTGNASANRTIPAWDNNGLSFAHTDFDDDLKGDVPCRSCHNSFHEISILNCQECHNSPPSGHTNIVEGYDYPDAPYLNCISCHGDPHDIGPGGGPNCTDCHLEGGSNTNWSGPILNRTGFFNSSHNNITGDFDANNYSAISMVCWGCHNDYGQQLVDPGHTRPASELPECEDCHFTDTPLNGDYLRKNPPIQIPEHQPLGEDVQTNISTNCTFCHNNSLSIPIPTTNVKYHEAKNYVSHYVSTTYLMTPTNNTTDCIWCHVDNSNNISWGYPPDPMTSTKFNHTDLNITNNSGCYPCHVSYKALNGSVLLPGFTFHNISMASGAGNDCVYCHDIGGIVGEEFQIDVQAMNQSGAIHYDLNRGAADTLDANNVRCWACHGDGDASEADQPLGHPVNFRNPRNCSEKDCHNVNQSTLNEPMVYEHFKYVDEIDENLTTAVDCPACHLNSIVNYQDSLIPSDTSLVSHYGSTDDLINTSSCIYCHLDEDNAEEWGNAPDPTSNISRPSDKEWESTLFVGDKWHLGNRYFLTFEDIAVDGDSAFLRLYQGDTLLDELVVDESQYYYYEGDFIDPDGRDITAIVLEINFTTIFRGNMETWLVKAKASPWKRIHPENKDPACWACHMDDYVIDKKRYLVLDEDEDRIYYVERLLDFSDDDVRDEETLVPRNLVLTEGYYQRLQVDGGDFILTAEEVDINGKLARITLSRRGTLIEEDIYREGEYLEYEKDLFYDGHKIDDVVIFTARIDSVFHGFDYDVVILTDVRVISDRLMAYDKDGKLGGFNTSQLHINDIFSIGGAPDTFHVPPLNEGIDGGSDCVYCHDTSNGFGISSVNAIETQLGGHSGLNANAASSVELSDDINKACWACHGDGVEPGRHPANYLFPRQCRDCHADMEEPTYGAVDLNDETHGQVEDCQRCHAADYPGLHVINVFEPGVPYIIRINVMPEVIRPDQFV